MADIQQTMSLDDSRFEQGLKKAYGAAQQHSEKMETAFGRLGSSLEGAMRFAVFREAAKQTFRIAQDAVEDYGKQFTFARRQMEDAGGALNKFRLEIGRSVFNLIYAPGDTGFLDKLYDKWMKLNNLIYDTFAGAGAGEAIDAMNAEREAADKLAQGMEKVADLRLRMRQEVFQARGQSSAAQIIGEQQKHIDNVKFIRDTLPAGSAQRAQMELLEQNRTDAVMRNIQAKADEERRAAADKLDAEKHGLEVDRERLKIQAMRLEGHQKDAEIAEVELQFSEKMRDIQRSQTLSDQDKKTAMFGLSLARGRLETALLARKGQGMAVGFTGTDVADVRVRQAVLGGASSGLDPVVRTAKEQLTQTVKSGQRLDDIGATLKAIERKTGRVIGVFG